MEVQTTCKWFHKIPNGRVLLEIYRVIHWTKEGIVYSEKCIDFIFQNGTLFICSVKCFITRIKILFYNNSLQNKWSPVHLVIIPKMTEIAIF